MAGSRNNPAGIAGDSTNVYWVDSSGGSGAVLRCALGGCGGAPTTIASGSLTNNPVDVAVGGSAVYWTNGGAGTVTDCATSGCGGSEITIASSQAGPLGIAVDATNVYWTDSGSSNAVMSRAIAGGAVTTLATGNQPFDIAIDSACVYWTDQGSKTLKKVAKP